MRGSSSLKQTTSMMKEMKEMKEMIEMTGMKDMKESAPEYWCLQAGHLPSPAVSDCSAESCAEDTQAD